MEENQDKQVVNEPTNEAAAEKLAEVVNAVAQHVNSFYALTRAEMVDKLQEFIQTRPISDAKQQIDSLKQSFYSKLKAENETKQAEGAENTTAEVDALELKFKELLAKYREVKATENAAIEAELEANLVAKQKVLDELEKLINSADDLSEVIPAFRKLQQDWKNIGHVPANRDAEIYKSYNAYRERFYDLIKINNELREYDFQKNLEAKTALCEQAEQLSSSDDAVGAFKLLQKLHDDWREIGPVAREMREEIWNRFKEASTVVNKRHQAYFESVKEQEEQFVAEKVKLCELIENIDTQLLKTYKHWDDKTQEIIDIQEQWKKIGGIASYKSAIKVLKRFRTACDKFFEAKKAFYKNTKTESNKNLDAKKALCEQAEALKDSTEWKETADKLVQLQKDWKQIGPTSNRKQSDAVWTRFVAACDYFFAQKAANFVDKHSEEINNLKAKKGVIEKFKAFVATGDKAKDLAALKALVEEYNQIGFVPFKEKDKLMKEYKDVTDKLFAQVRNAKSAEAADRSRLLKEYDRLKSEIATYENNIGFFGNSKNADKMVKEMQKKIDKLKVDFDKIVAKLKELDEQ